MLQIHYNYSKSPLYPSLYQLSNTCNHRCTCVSSTVICGKSTLSEHQCVVYLMKACDACAGCWVKLHCFDIVNFSSFYLHQFAASVLRAPCGFQKVQNWHTASAAIWSTRPRNQVLGIVYRYRYVCNFLNWFSIVNCNRLQIGSVLLVPLKSCLLYTSPSPRDQA